VGCLTLPSLLRRFQYPVRCRASRRRPALSSREVGRSSECCLHRSRRRIGLSAPSMTSLFPGSLSGFTSPPSPELLRARVHPPVSFTSPAEFEPLRTCPAPKCAAPPLEFSFPIAAPARRVHLRASLPLLTLRSALGVSHALDGLLLFAPCGFVSPRYHVRDSPLRGFDPPPSRNTSSAPRTLLSLPALACRRVSSTTPAPAASPSGS